MVEEKKVRELKGANMGIDLIPTPNVSWEMDKCPWNDAESNNRHKCAIKNISLCKFFCGIKKPDAVLCGYPDNPRSKS